jgi:17beta-estradiol 17-dehydrogenase / very-long-chain 3-oxoacyl-CoA reductase
MTRYGSKDGTKTWAVVTGGSDGIGLGMCKKFANEGFNVCIVSRTQSKIEDKLQEIKKECRANDDSFDTRAVVADFSKLKTIADYKEAIGEKIKDLNVGILVLNAGWTQPGAFNDLEDWEVE